MPLSMAVEPENEHGSRKPVGLMEGLTVGPREFVWTQHTTQNL
jgi:hypothetical protein